MCTKYCYGKPHGKRPRANQEGDGKISLKKDIKEVGCEDGK